MVLFFVSVFSLLSVTVEAQKYIKELKKMVSDAETNTYNYDSMKLEVAKVLNIFFADIEYFKKNKRGWVPRMELRERQTILGAMEYNFLLANTENQYLTITWDMYTPNNVWMKKHLIKMLDEFAQGLSFRKKYDSAFYATIYLNDKNETVMSVRGVSGRSDLSFNVYDRSGSEIQKNQIRDLAREVFIDQYFSLAKEQLLKEGNKIIWERKVKTLSGDYKRDLEYAYIDYAKEYDFTQGQGSKKQYGIMVIGRKLNYAGLLLKGDRKGAVPFVKTEGDEGSTGVKAKLKELELDMFAGGLESDGSNLWGLLLFSDVVREVRVFIYAK